MEDEKRATPPPVPAQPLPYASAQSTPPEQSYTEYDRVADKVGFVPNVRAKDNIRQLIAGAIGAVIGAVVAIVMVVETPLVITFGIGGFLAGAVLYGVYLAIVGLTRGRRPKG